MPGFHSRKKWGDFSRSVQNLRWTLRGWLEQLLPYPVTSWEGSDSIVYPPRNWSKYKLVPYDPQSMPPLDGLDEGVLVCMDHEECEKARLGELLERRVPQLQLHPPFVYEVKRKRSYRSVALPISQSQEERQTMLCALATVIRHLETAPL